MAEEMKGCGKIAYAYVPVQELEDTYEPAKGLMRGTIFPELDLPMEVYGKNTTVKEVR